MQVQSIIKGIVFSVIILMTIINPIVGFTPIIVSSSGPNNPSDINDRQKIASEEENVDSFDVNPKSGRWDVTESGSGNVEDTIIDGNLRVITSQNISGGSEYFMKRGLLELDPNVDYRYKMLVDNLSLVELYRDVLGDTADFEEDSEPHILFVGGSKTVSNGVYEHTSAGTATTVMYQSGFETMSISLDLIEKIEWRMRSNVSDFNYNLELWSSNLNSAYKIFAANTEWTDYIWEDPLSDLFGSDTYFDPNGLFYSWKLKQPLAQVVQTDIEFIKIFFKLDYATFLEGGIENSWDWQDSAEYFRTEEKNASDFEDGTTEDWTSIFTESMRNLGFSLAVNANNEYYYRHLLEASWDAYMPIYYDPDWSDFRLPGDGTGSDSFTYQQFTIPEGQTWYISDLGYNISQYYGDDPCLNIGLCITYGDLTYSKGDNGSQSNTNLDVRDDYESRIQLFYVPANGIWNATALGNWFWYRSPYGNDYFIYESYGDAMDFGEWDVERLKTSYNHISGVDTIRDVAIVDNGWQWPTSNDAPTDNRSTLLQAFTIPYGEVWTVTAVGSDKIGDGGSGSTGLIGIVETLNGSAIQDSDDLPIIVPVPDWRNVRTSVIVGEEATSWPTYSSYTWTVPTVSLTNGTYMWFFNNTSPSTQNYWFQGDLFNVSGSLDYYTFQLNGEKALFVEGAGSAYDFDIYTLMNYTKSYIYEYESYLSGNQTDFTWQDNTSISNTQWTIDGSTPSHVQLFEVPTGEVWTVTRLGHLQLADRGIPHGIIGITGTKAGFYNRTSDGAQVDSWIPDWDDIKTYGLTRETGFAFGSPGYASWEVTPVLLTEGVYAWFLNATTIDGSNGYWYKVDNSADVSKNYTLDIFCCYDYPTKTQWQGEGLGTAYWDAFPVINYTISSYEYFTDVEGDSADFLEDSEGFIAGSGTAVVKVNQYYSPYFLPDLKESEVELIYHFNGGEIDSSSYGRDGTPTGITYTSGRFDQSADIDGSGDTIATPSFAFGSTTYVISWSFWVYFDGMTDGTGQSVWNDNPSGVAGLNETNIRLDYNSAGGGRWDIVFQTQSSESGALGILGTGGDTSYQNVWTNIIITQESITGKLTFYRNGVQFYTITHANYQSFPGVNQVKNIGIGGSYNDVTSPIDEFIVYSRLLTSSEIESLAKWRTTSGVLEAFDSSSSGTISFNSSSLSIDSDIYQYLAFSFFGDTTGIINEIDIQDFDGNSIIFDQPYLATAGWKAGEWHTVFYNLNGYDDSSPWSQCYYWSCDYESWNETETKFTIDMQFDTSDGTVVFDYFYLQSNPSWNEMILHRSTVDPSDNSGGFGYGTIPGYDALAWERPDNTSQASWSWATLCTSGFSSSCWDSWSQLFIVPDGEVWYVDRLGYANVSYHGSPTGLIGITDVVNQSLGGGGYGMVPDWNNVLGSGITGTPPNGNMTRVSWSLNNTIELQPGLYAWFWNATSGDPDGYRPFTHTVTSATNITKDYFTLVSTGSTQFYPTSTADFYASIYVTSKPVWDPTFIYYNQKNTDLYPNLYWTNWHDYNNFSIRFLPVNSWDGKNENNASALDIIQNITVYDYDHNVLCFGDYSSSPIENGSWQIFSCGFYFSGNWTGEEYVPQFDAFIDRTERALYWEFGLQVAIDDYSTDAVWIDYVTLEGGVKVNGTTGIVGLKAGVDVTGLVPDWSLIYGQYNFTQDDLSSSPTLESWDFSSSFLLSGGSAGTWYAFFTNITEPVDFGSSYAISFTVDLTGGVSGNFTRELRSFWNGSHAIWIDTDDVNYDHFSHLNYTALANDYTPTGIVGIANVTDNENSGSKQRDMIMSEIIWQLAIGNLTTNTTWNYWNAEVILPAGTYAQFFYVNGTCVQTGDYCLDDDKLYDNGYIFHFDRRTPTDSLLSLTMEVVSSLGYDFQDDPTQHLAVDRKYYWGRNYTEIYVCDTNKTCVNSVDSYPNITVDTVMDPVVVEFDSQIWENDISVDVDDWFSTQNHSQINSFYTTFNVPIGETWIVDSFSFYAKSVGSPKANVGITGLKQCTWGVDCNDWTGTYLDALGSGPVNIPDWSNVYYNGTTGAFTTTLEWQNITLDGFSRLQLTAGGYAIYLNDTSSTFDGNYYYIQYNQDSTGVENQTLAGSASTNTTYGWWSQTHDLNYDVGCPNGTAPFYSNCGWDIKNRVHYNRSLINGKIYTGIEFFYRATGASLFNNISLYDFDDNLIGSSAVSPSSGVITGIFLNVGSDDDWNESSQLGFKIDLVGFSGTFEFEIINVTVKSVDTMVRIARDFKKDYFIIEKGNASDFNDGTTEGWVGTFSTELFPLDNNYLKLNGSAGSGLVIENLSLSIDSDYYTRLIVTFNTSNDLEYVALQDSDFNTLCFSNYFSSGGWYTYTCDIIHAGWTGTETELVLKFINTTYFPAAESVFIDSIYLEHVFDDAIYDILITEVFSEEKISSIIVRDGDDNTLTVCDSISHTAGAYQLFQCDFSSESNWNENETLLDFQIIWDNSSTLGTFGALNSTVLITFVAMYDTLYGDNESWDVFNTASDALSYVLNGQLHSRKLAGTTEYGAIKIEGLTIDADMFDRFYFTAKAETTTTIDIVDSAFNDLDCSFAITTSWADYYCSVRDDSDWSGTETEINIRDLGTTTGNLISFEYFSVAATGTEQRLTVGFWDNEDEKSLVNITQHWFNASMFRWEIELYDDNWEIASYYYSDNQTIEDAGIASFSSDVLVDGFVSEVQEWIESGSTPFLSAVDGSNFIFSNNTDILWVDGFTLSSTDWNTSGSSPYLDALGGAYIYVQGEPSVSNNLVVKEYEGDYFYNKFGDFSDFEENDSEGWETVASWANLTVSNGSMRLEINKTGGLTGNLPIWIDAGLAFSMYDYSNYTFRVRSNDPTVYLTDISFKILGGGTEYCGDFPSSSGFNTTDWLNVSVYLLGCGFSNNHTRDGTIEFDFTETDGTLEEGDWLEIEFILLEITDDWSAEWETFGNSPWMDAVDGTNYIQAEADGLVQKWFNLTAETSLHETGYSVKVEAYILANDIDDDLNWGIDTNGDNTTECTGSISNPTVGWNTDDDVVSCVTTKSTLNSARISITKSVDSAAGNMSIDAIRFNVTRSASSGLVDRWFTFENTSITYSSDYTTEIGVYVLEGNGVDDIYWEVDVNGDDTRDYWGTIQNPTFGWYYASTPPMITKIGINNARLSLSKIAGSLTPGNMTIDAAVLRAVHNDLQHGWFTFGNIASNHVDGYTAYLSVYVLETDGDDDIEWQIDTNGDNTPECVGFLSNPVFGWNAADPSSFESCLDTKSEINSARVLFIKSSSDVPNDMKIDAAKLIVSHASTIDSSSCFNAYCRVAIEFDILRSEFEIEISADSGIDVFDIDWSVDFTTVNTPELFAHGIAPRIFVATHAEFYGHTVLWLDFIDTKFLEQRWRQTQVATDSDFYLQQWQFSEAQSEVKWTAPPYDWTNPAETAIFQINVPRLDSFSLSYIMGFSNMTPSTYLSFQGMFMVSVYAVDWDDGESHQLFRLEMHSLFLSALYWYSYMNIYDSSDSLKRTVTPLSTGIVTEGTYPNTYNSTAQYGISFALQDSRDKGSLNVRYVPDTREANFITDLVQLYNISEITPDASQEFIIQFAHRFQIEGSHSGSLTHVVEDFDFIERDWFSDAFNFVGDIVGGILAPFINFLASIFITVFRFLAMVITAIIDPIVQGLGAIFTAVVNVLSATLEAAINVLGPIFEAAIAALEPILQGIIDAFDPLLSLLDSLLGDLIDLMTTLLGDLIDEIIELASTIWDVLVDVMEDIIEAVIPFLGQIFDAIVNVVIPIIADTWDQVWSAVFMLIDPSGGLKAFVDGIFQVAIPSFIESFINIFTAMAAIISFVFLATIFWVASVPFYQAEDAQGVIHPQKAAVGVGENMFRGLSIPKVSIMGSGISFTIPIVLIIYILMKILIAFGTIPDVLAGLPI